MKIYVRGQRCPQWLERTENCTARFDGLLNFVWCDADGWRHILPVLGASCIVVEADDKDMHCAITGGGAGVFLHAPFLWLKPKRKPRDTTGDGRIDWSSFIVGVCAGACLLFLLEAAKGWFW